MATENALIDGALRSWHSNMDRVGRFFRSLSDDDLQKEIALGKNRLIYIWGHLSATNDRMIPLLGFGERRYPELDLIFISQPDRAVPIISRVTPWATCGANWAICFGVNLQS